MTYRSTRRGAFIAAVRRLGPLSLSVATALLVSNATAPAGPCSAQIEQLRDQIAEVGPAAPSEPTAAQSTGAQLHHQPTPSSVGQAQHVASKDADAALERAKSADAANDAASCNAAVTEARRLYDIRD